MAGAVPQQRGGSNTSTIVMVISIVVAVALLGVLIWLITQQEQLRTGAESAKSEAKRANTAKAESDRNAATLGRMLGGSDKDAASTAIKKFEDALAKIAADEKVPNKDQYTSAFGAAGVVDNIFTVYSDERSGREAAEADRDKANKDLKAVQDKLAEVEKNFGSDLTKLSKRVDDLQLAKAAFEKLKSADIEALQSQISSKQDALENMRKASTDMGNRLKAEVHDRERLLDEQKTALANLRGPAAEGAQELAAARKPVGIVMRALPGDSLVHIDLGRDNNVQLGMTFSVYSADQRVPVDGRGKAAVEVVGLGQRTAECRVTAPAPPDDPILESDRVGNIVLAREKGKKPRFCLVGGFDIDFDGNVDANGAEAVAALVERWGGQVVSGVDATTDYLVMGVEPSTGAPAMMAKPAAKVVAKPAAEEAKKPAESGEAPADEGEEEKPAEEEGAEAKKPEAEEAKTEDAPKIEKAQEKDLTAEPQARRVASDRDRYEEAVRRAEKFAIPRLPADRFYNFVGLDSGARASAALHP